MPGLQIFTPKDGELIKSRRAILASGWADPTTVCVRGECCPGSGSGSVIQGDPVAFTKDQGAPGRPPGYRWLILFRDVPIGSTLLTVTGEHAKCEDAEAWVRFSIGPSSSLVPPFRIIDPQPHSTIDSNDFNPYGDLPSNTVLADNNPNDSSDGPVVMKENRSGSFTKADTSGSDRPTGTWWAQYITIPQGKNYTLNVKYQGLSGTGGGSADTADDLTSST